jgi:hypothetical protein
MKIDKKERISRASSIIFECQSEMSVSQLEKLANAALNILYPEKRKKEYIK